MPSHHHPPGSAFDKARAHKPTKQMKKLNWEKLHKNTAIKTGTMWHKAVVPGAEPKVKLVTNEIEELFSRVEIVKGKKEKEETDQKKPSVVTILDQKTSLNINIFLKQFKMPNEQLVAIVNEGNCTKISVDQLKALQKLLPDKGTIDSLKAYTGDRALLGTGEDFFMRLLELKQYPVRIEAMQIKLEFQDKLTDIKPSLQILQIGVQELLECTSFREICYVALVTGNIINGVSLKKSSQSRGGFVVVDN
jgi:hypothetical protein